jgi:hypothetical protein
MKDNAMASLRQKSQSVSKSESQMQIVGKSTFHFVDNRLEAVAQRKLQEMANISPRAMQLKAFQDMANNSPQATKTAQLRVLEDNHSAQKQHPIQKKENNTGLPDNLKSGMENLSGISLDDVKVHRNSDKPAQLQAHAYAQGTDIHLASGQEKHLPHEAWHVVQQKQGRVKPTMQMKGMVNVNDDAGLEKEADVMGVKAQGINQLTISEKELETTTSSSNLIQGMFSVNTKVYQFGGEGASKWIPAAVALGAGLYLVYRSLGQKNGEISAEEAQEHDYVSSEDVVQHSEDFGAIPSNEEDLGATPSNEEDPGAVQSDEGSSEPVESQGGLVPSVTSYQTGSSGTTKPGSKEKQKKDKYTIAIGEGEEWLKPVEPIDKVQKGSITGDYDGPKVSKNQNSITAKLLTANAQIRTPGSLTETKASLGSTSIERGNGSIDMKVGLGEASVDYQGQHTRGKALVEGPNTGLHIGADSLSVQGSAGKAYAEGAASIKGGGWGATLGVKGDVDGPSFKVGTDGTKINGISTSVTGGVSISRETNQGGPNIAEQVFWLKRELGKLPEIGVNPAAIRHIVEDNPEFLEKVGNAVIRVYEEDFGDLSRDSDVEAPDSDEELSPENVEEESNPGSSPLKDEILKQTEEFFTSWS